MEFIEPIKITLDKERVLWPTLHAMRKAKTEYGVNLLKGVNVEDLEDPEKMAVILWTCLYHEDKTLTVDAVSELVTPRNVMDVTIVVLKALTISFPEAKPGVERPNASSLPVS